MKKIITTLALSIFLLNTLFANNEAYLNAMKANIHAMEIAKTKEDLQTVANTFERISKNATKEWLPLYYAAYTYINMSQMEETIEKKEPTLEKSRSFIDQLLLLVPNESEAVLMDGYYTMMKLSLNPAERGQTYAPKATGLFQKAVQLNPNNPRAYFFLAHMEYGTAKFFGSSTENACATFKKSVSLFEAEVKKDDLSPSWGKEGAQQMASTCQ
jgi:tetratricopeptide (TPR) repeat protein